MSYERSHSMLILDIEWAFYHDVFKKYHIIYYRVVGSLFFVNY